MTYLNIKNSKKKNNIFSWPVILFSTQREYNLLCVVFTKILKIKKNISFTKNEKRICMKLRIMLFSMLDRLPDSLSACLLLWLSVKITWKFSLICYTENWLIIVFRQQSLHPHTVFKTEFCLLVSHTYMCA